VSVDGVVLAVTMTRSARTASARDFRPTLVALRALGLGDLLTAVPAWRALERAFRGYHRYIAAPRPLQPLVEMLGASHLPVQPLHRLPELPITVAVNLHGRGPQSDEVLLERAPRELLAYAHPDVGATHDGPAWDDDEHEAERWCRLLRAYGIDADASELDVSLPPAPASVGGIADIVDARTTIVHPGAAAPARRWPADRFAAVARAEREADRRVVVTGSNDERELAGAVVRDAGLPCHALLAGRTDLRGLMALVARAGRVVCGDTGVAHLATATRTPSVVLFGPTPPKRWGPPVRPWHRVLWAGRDGDPHGLRADPGLLEISVGDVIDALATLPGRPAPAR
jgi:Glycosyltransferase family 9 (heptosyltransferase)